MRRAIACVAILLTTSTSACLDLGDARAERDAKVGKASGFGASIDVVDGLAAVRSFGDGEVVLWGQAPTLQWSFKTGPQPRSWRFSLRNIVPDATLQLAREGQTLSEVTRETTVLPTAASWSAELDANTTYTMRVGLTGTEASAPFRFLVFADVQNAIDSVQDIYKRMRDHETAEFCLISGDLTMNGTEAEFTRFESELKTLHIPCFAAPGNHDISSSDTRWHDTFGRGNFSFTHRGARFTLLDSASATISPKVWPWLDKWLAAGKNSAHLVMMHIPPLDVDGARSGAFASRAEAHQLLTKLADADVDLTIYGHVHTYAAYQNAGIPAIITGGGGAIPMRLDGIGRHFLSMQAFPSKQRFEAAVVRVYPE